MSIVGTVFFATVFFYGLFSLARLAYVKSVPVRHHLVNHQADRHAIELAETDRLIREQEHELWPDKKHRHVNCSVCGPGPLKQGVVPSRFEHPFFTKKMESVSDGYGSWQVETLRAALPEYAEIVSSKIIDTEHGVYTDQHSLMLDLDFPCNLIESSTPGHYHFYGDRRMGWHQYKRVLKVLWQAGVIEHGYYRAAIRQGATHLRPPWVKKPSGPSAAQTISRETGRRWMRRPKEIS